jgi:hypothetical protein
VKQQGCTTDLPIDDLLRDLAEHAEGPLTRSWAKAMLAGEAASAELPSNGDDEQQ